MNQRLLNTTLIISMMSIMIVCYVNCGNPKVGHLKSPSTVGPNDPLKKPIINQASLNFCTTASQNLNSKVIIIAALDISGSNFSWESANVPTDCKGERRFTSLTNFIDSPELPDGGNYYFRLIKFGNEAASQKKTTGSGDVTKTNNKTLFKNMIADARFEAINGTAQETNYRAALTNIKEVVSADIDQARLEESTLSIIIIFISDGVPLVQGFRQDYRNGIQNTAELVGMVSDITSLGETDANAPFVDSIIFNTGFYSQDLQTAVTLCGTPTPRAQATPTPFVNPLMQAEARILLNDMRVTGDGSFTDFGSGNAIPFEQFVTFGAQTSYELSDVWISNLNTVWWNGQLLADSDADTLPDAIESQLNSNLFNSDSDGDGASDGVTFFTSQNQEPCKRKLSGNCDINLIPNTTTCTNVAYKDISGCKCVAANISTETVSGKLQFKDRDKDGLNDCDEFLLGSDSAKPDTNADNIPDDLAFRRKFTLVGSETERSTRSYLDGMRLDIKLLQYLPLDISASLVPSFIKPYETTRTLDTSRTDSTRSCYAQNTFQITQLPVKPNGGTETTDNTIQVILVENQTRLSKRQIIRYGEKTLTKGAGVAFTDNGRDDYPKRLSNGQ